MLIKRPIRPFASLLVYSSKLAFHCGVVLLGLGAGTAVLSWPSCMARAAELHGAGGLAARCRCGRSTMALLEMVLNTDPGADGELRCSVMVKVTLMMV